MKWTPLSERRAQQIEGTHRWFAWFPVWCEDVRENVWCEQVWRHVYHSFYDGGRVTKYTLRALKPKGWPTK